MNTTTPSTKDQLIGKLCETSTGSIRLVDVMGDDHRVVQAARISFGKQAQVINADKDRALLRYLMRNRHTSPFEQCELTFIVECPMDLWRQWVRHRTANVNEYSTRYAPAFNNAAMAATRPDSWRLQATNNKQGSDGLLLSSEVASLLLSSDSRASLAMCIRNGSKRAWRRSKLARTCPCPL